MGVRVLRWAIPLLAILGTGNSAWAQDRAEQQGWGLTLGAGALHSPIYEGDDASRLSLLPSIQLQYGERFSASVENGARYRLVDAPNFRAGPIARLKFSRDDDGDGTFAVAGDGTEDLRGLGDVNASIEVGGFVDYEIGPLTLSAEGRQAATGHESFVADFAVQWRGRGNAFGPPMFWSFGPRMRVVGDEYVETYFGVNAAQAAASGLPQYVGRGGVHSYGVGASVVTPLSERLAVIAFAGYDRLTGDAADSPLVTQRGSEHQTSVGVFLSYKIF